MRARFLLTAALALTATAMPACMFFAKPPADLDYAPSRVSASGTYRITHRTSGETIPLRKLHQWQLHVETADGRPVDDATITVDGGMPQHGHGLPTRPRVTQTLGNGEYVVDGMKFNMGGWWTVTVLVQGAAGRDSATFNVKL